MEAAFCVETPEDALARCGRLKIFNTDGGSQFTGAASTGMLASHGTAISMDGRGAWRGVKYEAAYLRAAFVPSRLAAHDGSYTDAN